MKKRRHGELDRAMAWMDEIIRRNKKVLIHCRLGIGRTGTVLYAYLSSRGLKSRLQETAIQKLRCRPANYCQWQLVQKYGQPGGFEYKKDLRGIYLSKPG